ncbi:MAG TPA: hypothetical protein VG757_16215 [Devosia sp.]|nr:hypothetical protein [Devosia sp.]
MARPVKRAAPLSIRLNEIERAALTRRAGGTGLSTFAKSILFGEGRGGRATASADRALLAKVLGQLGASGLGPNLDRLAEAADSGSLFVDELTAMQLRYACEDIRQMRQLLMAALGWPPQALGAVRPATAFALAARAGEPGQ